MEQKKNYISASVNFFLCCVLCILAYTVVQILPRGTKEQVFSVYQLLVKLVFFDGYQLVYISLIFSTAMVLALKKISVFIKKYLLMRRVIELERVASVSKQRIVDLECQIFEHFYHINSEIIEAITPARLLMESLEAKVIALNAAIKSEDPKRVYEILHAAIYVNKTSGNSVLFSDLYAMLPEKVEVDECEELLLKLFRSITHELRIIKSKCSYLNMAVVNKSWRPVIN